MRMSDLKRILPGDELVLLQIDGIPIDGVNTAFDLPLDTTLSVKSISNHSFNVTYDGNDGLVSRIVKKIKIDARRIK